MSNKEVVPMSPAINQDDESYMMELKAVIDSISQGKSQLFKKATFQAFSAAISHEDHVVKVQDHLNLVNAKYSQAKNKIIAYRVIDINAQNGVSEGFDDDGEEGSGRKLLTLLQKMGIENILVIVCIWHNGMPGHLGTDFYRMVLERARDLLTALHKEVLQQENDDTELNQFIGSSPVASNNTKQVLESKVYNIAEAVEIGKRDSLATKNSPSAHKKFIEEHSIEMLPKIDEDEYKKSIKNLEKAGKYINKSHIREFLSFVRPEPIINKLFQVLAIIKGYKNPNWIKIRDMLSNPTFRLELLSFRGHDYDSDNVLKAFKIFESSAIAFTGKSPRHRNHDFYTKYYEILPSISDGAVHIFDWIISFFKSYSGYSKFGPPVANYVEMNEDPEEITLRTKIKVRKQIIKNRSANVSVPVKVIH